MHEMTDTELLREYVHRNSDGAFAALVTRHVNMIYSAALRKTGNPHAAEEITQAVFIILAKKGRGLNEKTILCGWLYQTARLTAINYLRTEIRRSGREQEAYMQSLSTETEPEVWPRIVPLLEDAMGRLREKDRNAVALRFLEGKSFQEIGTALGASENAAKKRVSHALEKLRRYFSKRGVISTTAIIAGAISANSVHAAPIGLTAAITATAVKGATVPALTLSLVKGTINLMTWIKTKTAIVVGVSVIVAAGATASIYEEIWQHPDSRSLDSLEKAPPALIVRPTRYPNRHGGVWTAIPNGKGFSVNLTLPYLIGVAYGCDQARMILPDDLPTGGYDLMETLPNGQNEPALREEIKKQFHLTARREVRETAVWLLKVKDAGKLQSKLGKGGQASVWMTSKTGVWDSLQKSILGDATVPQDFIFKNEPPSVLAQQFEDYFKKPILDQTGLQGGYDLDFQWRARTSDSPETGMKIIRQALSNQLGQFGFELAPGRERLEMLVVEKAR